MALIPPWFIDCVVAIGINDAIGMRRWIASGFLYGHLRRKVDDEHSEYGIKLITNRHVFKDKTLIYIRCNPRGSKPAREYALNLNLGGKQLWYSHPNIEIDVAVIPINFRLLKEHGMSCEYFSSDHHIAPINQLLECGTSEGDFAYILGFPMGLGVELERNSVVVRGGPIARIRDTLERTNPVFLVDAFVFPGNSGGPVISKPELVKIEGTKSVTVANLIGIVKAYVPYRDYAVSEQTGERRVIFEENSGLAAVHPIDYILEVVELSEQLDNEVNS